MKYEVKTWYVPLGKMGSARAHLSFTLEADDPNFRDHMHRVIKDAVANYGKPPPAEVEEKREALGFHMDEEQEEIEDVLKKPRRRK